MQEQNLSKVDCQISTKESCNEPFTHWGNENINSLVEDLGRKVWKNSTMFRSEDLTTSGELSVELKLWQFCGVQHELECIGCILKPRCSDNFNSAERSISVYRSTAGIAKQVQRNSGLVPLQNEVLRLLLLIDRHGANASCNLPILLVVTQINVHKRSNKPVHLATTSLERLSGSDVLTFCVC